MSISNIIQESDFKFGNVMLDLETMGSESYSAIVSIGAIEFDIVTGKMNKTFYVNVDLDNCLKAGLKVTANTIYWWLKQSESARAKLTDSEKYPLLKALELFSYFLKSCGDKDVKLWGNGVRFDVGILQNAYNALNIPIPWEYFNERDVRTLVSFAPEIKKNEPLPKTAHDALQDCAYQISYCSKIWRKINNIQL